MQVDLYFDPACPWCWITSRWVLLASNQRDIQINWKLFSLAWKNGEFEGAKNNYDHMPSHRVERVILAASQKGASVQDLYTNFGIKHFLSGDEYNDQVIKEVLDKLNLDSELINASNDQSLDEQIIASSKEALKEIGEDIGVPAIVLKINNQKRGFFGPVLRSLPEQDQAVQLWDAFTTLAQNSDFYEIKRGRSNSPDVYSTAKC